ncbi:MAG: nucleotide exchange factor GrpE [Candidatus Magasanikbacteria bacterium RIFCSPLOWO2_02_FULL_44_11]|uniref:Protein GrpE n=2 Tax=Candidatus Magasanikiibacteriota TaxID=1752731 RepID=A0A1F6N9C1_9BACT|nr:MAG: nucleotide exchange factor GrpE [Candidatus Magasanikbacteria bacterium RIFCSPHIGHO2_02_FULL_45_10]OGH80323.1 MAG: nucleotide exchange factor GrpE [Candidatus Magasanikbacteria bacterium RIFCSPLOWO2_02_FULL_44_11]
MSDEKPVSPKSPSNQESDTMNKQSDESAVEKERDEYKQGWQRAVADYQNLQKEISARRQEWILMSKQQIIEDFIPVYDNFKKAFALHPDVNDQKQVKSWVDGIGHIMRQFQDVLKTHQVEEIKTVGEQFDPRFHEAIGVEENGKEYGLIVREVYGGYRLGEQVIKVAKVIISK